MSVPGVFKMLTVCFMGVPGHIKGVTEGFNEFKECSRPLGCQRFLAEFQGLSRSFKGTITRRFRGAQGVLRCVSRVSVVLSTGDFRGI